MAMVGDASHLKCYTQENLCFLNCASFTEEHDLYFSFILPM